RRLVDMLQLAAAARIEVPARRFRMVRTMVETACDPEAVARRRARDVPPVRRDTVAPRCDADDQVGIAGHPAGRVAAVSIAALPLTVAGSR
ncbi:hypothetical protein NL368_26945, partial [Klebsiella pneumoniae]|nr:hypothetical protein [Klebsiella pneumoniae]